MMKWSGRIDMLKENNVGFFCIKMACYFYIIYSFMPLVQYYITFPFSFIPFLLLCLGVLLSGKQNNVWNIFISLFLIMIYNILIYFGQWMEMTSFASKMWALIIGWSSVPMTICLIDIHDKFFYKRILFFLLLIATITSITTIIQLYKEPMASRYLATGRFDLYDLDLYIKNNTGGYGFIYSLVLLMPALIYLFKKRVYNRVFLLLIIILFYYCIIVSQYTIGIVLAVMCLPLFIVKLKNTKFLIIVILIMPLILLLKNQIGNLLISLSDTPNLYFVSVRLKQLASLLQGTDMEGSHDRLILYRLSIDAFLKSPLLGRLSFIFEKQPIGRHSEFLDLMGSNGLLGIGVFIILFIFSFKTIFRSKNIKHNVFFLYNILLYFVLGLINTIHLPMMFTIFFVWYCVLSINGKEKENEL